MLIESKRILKEFVASPLIGVVQIGAHIGEEIDVYFSMGAEKVIAFEPIKNSYDRIQPHENLIKVNKAVGNYNGVIKLNIASNAQSTSPLKPKTHLIEHPWVSFNNTINVPITTLNSWFLDENQNPNEYNFMSIDVQGYELEVLKGASNIIPNMQAILCEVNKKELYENCPMVEQIDDFLKEYGFTRVETIWYENNGWGDALYSKA
jgi:FkbM family methyltransferase